MEFIICLTVFLFWSLRTKIPETSLLQRRCIKLPSLSDQDWFRSMVLVYLCVLCICVCFRFMNRRAAANCRYQPTCYEHAANCYTHAVSGLNVFFWRHAVIWDNVVVTVAWFFIYFFFISSSSCRPSWAWRCCIVCRTPAGRGSLPGCTEWACVPSSWSPLCFISSPGRRVTWGEDKLTLPPNTQDVLALVYIIHEDKDKRERDAHRFSFFNI